MSSRNPYMISTLGHFVVLGMLLLLSMLQRPSILLDDVIFVMPPATDRGASEATGAPGPEVVRPTQDPEPEPPRPEPPRVEQRKRPQPEINIPKDPEPGGVLPPPEDEIPSERPTVRDPPPQVTPREPAPAGGSTAATAGQTGGIGIEGGVLGARAPWYLVQLRDKIATSWRPPAAIGRQGEASTRVHFLLHPDGGVTEVAVLESSRSSLYDRAAMRGIFEAAPFPPLPEEIGVRTIGIRLTFTRVY